MKNKVHSDDDCAVTFILKVLRELGYLCHLICHNKDSGSATCNEEMTNFVASRQFVSLPKQNYYTV